MFLAPKEKLPLHSQFSSYLAGERIYPINVEISPSGICQATCPFCFYANTGELGSHRNVMLNQDRLVGLLHESNAMGVKSISWTGGGDPALYPAIDRVVGVANVLGFDQGMFTNALAAPRFDPARLNWIRVTVTDKPIRRECIKPLRACRRLGFAFNYAGPQDDERLQQVLAIALGLEADYVQLRPALKFHGETVDITPPKIEHKLLKVTGYKFDEAKRTHGYNTCEGYHFVPFVWEDGNVDVCAYMRKHEGYTLGNIYKQSFKEILDSAPSSVPVLPKCQVCCRNHEINKAVHATRLLEDRNFP